MSYSHGNRNEDNIYKCVECNKYFNRLEEKYHTLYDTGSKKVIYFCHVNCVTCYKKVSGYSFIECDKDYHHAIISQELDGSFNAQVEICDVECIDKIPERFKEDFIGFVYAYGHESKKPYLYLDNDGKYHEDCTEDRKLCIPFLVKRKLK